MTINGSELKSYAKIVINNLAKDFQGDHAFFFHNESDIQCRLFRRLTQRKVDIELVHAEYGMYWDDKTKSKSRGYFDIAIWRPDKKDAAIELWGKSAREFSRQMANIVAVAIEIDYFYGSATEKRSKFETIKELKRNRDIQKLIEVAQNKADSYLIIFWDHDVNEDEAASASCHKIHQTLGKLCHQYGVKSILVSRDHMIKRCGFR